MEAHLAAEKAEYLCESTVLKEELETYLNWISEGTGTLLCVLLCAGPIHFCSSFCSPHDLKL